MTTAQQNAIIRFEPDGYDVTQPWLMGRQVAGNGFLRAAVTERGEGPLYCHTPSRLSATAFARFVGEIDADAETQWILPGKIAASPSIGRTLYLADPLLTPFARARLREGLTSYSLCGVTHTTATASAIGAIADLLVEPVTPWDALVCTSEAVAETVNRVIAARSDYLRWKFKAEFPLTTPQLPVIPLGVHCSDFNFSEAERLRARAELGLAASEVAALFVGRLTFTGKAHPFQMLHSLQTVALQTGQKIVFIQCGWAASAGLDAAFKAAAAEYAPDVRLIVLDGREMEPRRKAWSAADLFVSISDGVQETFGLTPLEAMAAGLPCVVSDWNGYKDTVRHGVDGFRIKSWAPGPGMVGAEIASMQEAGVINYDEYLYAMSSATSVDMAELTASIAKLVANPALRRNMGAAGRARAKSVFDWAHVFKSYQALWSDLDARRRAAIIDANQRAHAKAAPASAATALDPFHTFEHYPTYTIVSGTGVALVEPDAQDRYGQRFNGVMFKSTKAEPALARPILAALAAGPQTIGALAATTGRGQYATATLVGMLAKMGVVALSPPLVSAQ